MTATEWTLATALTASASAKITARVNGAIQSVNVARDLTVATGDVVIVGKVTGQWFAIGRAFTAAPADVDPPPPPPPVFDTAVGTLLLPAIWTGTYRDGGWVTGSTDTEQGSRGGAGNATGVAFYGYKAGSLAGATVTGARVRLVRAFDGSASSVTPTLQQIVEAAYDGSAPTLAGTSTAGPSLAPGATVDYALDPAWGQALVNAGGGALGVYAAGGSPYVRLTGTGEQPDAWLLALDWQR